MPPYLEASQRIQRKRDPHPADESYHVRRENEPVCPEHGINDPPDVIEDHSSIRGWVHLLRTLKGFFLRQFLRRSAQERAPGRVLVATQTYSETTVCSDGYNLTQRDKAANDRQQYSDDGCNNSWRQRIRHGVKAKAACGLVKRRFFLQLD